MSWIIFSLLFVLCLVLIYRSGLFASGDIPKSWLLGTFILKILVGIFFLWIYTNYYTKREEADVYKYFDDALLVDEIRKSSFKDYFLLVSGLGEIEKLSEKYLSESRFWDRNPSLPYFSDNRFIIRFHAILMPLSAGNIFIHLLFANLISFLGLFYLFRSLETLIQIHSRLLFLTLLLLPSLLFWTSSMLKENILLFGFGLYLFSLFRLSEKRIFLLTLIISALLIAQSKIYVLFILIPLSIAFVWSKGRNMKASLFRYSLVLIFFISLALNVGLYFPEYDIKSILAFKQSEFKCLAEWMGAGSQVHIPDLDNSSCSFIIALPMALFNTLFRPLPWDKLNTLGILSMLEILGIYSSLILAFIYRKKGKRLNPQYFLFCLFFVLLLAALIGWTTPVIGAIVRYRIVLLPFLILAAFSLIDFKKMGKFAPTKLFS